MAACFEMRNCGNGSGGLGRGGAKEAEDPKHKEKIDWQINGYKYNYNYI
jgi:hypothetical protein